MYREPDLIDVWFDSGAMPYAQWGIPYAEKLKAGDPEAWKKYPASFIAEGVDQTRGWFYTLHALAVMLFDSVAYHTVISNGLVLDKEGKKMSKSQGNVVDPFMTIEKSSADVTRWYLVSNANPWDSVKFDESGLIETRNKFFGTLYNTYSFFTLYANVDGFQYAEDKIKICDRPELDQWLVSKLNSLVLYVTESLDDFEPTKAARAIQDFVDEHLSNWHVRLSRKRFWRGEYEVDKIAAYQTLYEALLTVSKLMAPISPFFADWLYQSMNAVTQQETHQSVHLSSFPIADETVINRDLEQKMQMAQDACSLILSIRKKEKLKVRQPLAKAMIPVSDAHMQAQLEAVAGLIMHETNIKALEYLTPQSEHQITKKAKANFKLLGAKLGGLMKDAAQVIASLSQEQIHTLEKEHILDLEINGQVIQLTNEEIEIIADDIPGWSVASKDELTLALDLSLNNELIQEGIARELINRVQNLRKDSGLDVVDRIVLQYQGTELVKESVQCFHEYICAEVLADKLIIKEEILSLEDELNGEAVSLHIEKV
jgi:isoleucyl-tRNA synthetase